MGQTTVLMSIRRSTCRGGKDELYLVGGWLLLSQSAMCLKPSSLVTVGDRHRRTLYASQSAVRWLLSRSKSA